MHITSSLKFWIYGGGFLLFLGGILYYFFPYLLYSLRLRFVYFTGLRYLRKRFTSYIAILGVMVGVMVLVVVLSVMGGFQNAFWERLRSSSGDLTIEAYSYYGVYDYDRILKEMEKIPGIRHGAPFIHTVILMESTGVDYGFLKGIDLKREKKMGKFSKYLLSPRKTYLKLYGLDKEPTPQDIQKSYQKLALFLKNHGIQPPSSAEMPEEYPAKWPKKGFPLFQNFWNLQTILEKIKDLPDTISLSKTKSGLPGVLVGLQLFKVFGLQIGSTITLSTISAKALEGLENLPRSKLQTREQEFEVVGTVKVGIYNQDRKMVYTSIENAQKFVGVEGRVSGINLQCEDYRQAERLKWEIRLKLQDMGMMNELFVKTWKEKNRSLYQAVQMEKALLTILLFFIVMVAGFMIFAILSMMVVEKTKDVGILKALGSPSEAILSIFICQGVLIGILGIALGLAGGLAISYNINEIADFIHALTGFHPFPPKIYYLDRIPVFVDYSSISLISIMTFIVSFIFSLYPAIRASRFNAIQALRYE
ncbi:MAG: ABC transporter permease [Planctomycetota bacterium]|nr:MAG: ABC transporter permease [Planctomycetota bacterium]